MLLVDTTHSLTLLALLTLMFAPSVALAQQESGRMSTEQIELLNEANRELIKAEPDLKAAEELMAKALERGERFDLLLLTQGRIVQKQDRCEEAKKFFGEINLAPHEPSQTKEDIKRIKNKYIDQMETLCSAQLRLTCADANTTLKLGALDVSCEETVKVTPGFYTLQAALGDQKASYDLELTGAELRTYRVGLVAVADDEPEEVAIVAPMERATTAISDTTPAQAPTHRRYRKTLISGVSTLALTGLSALTWGVATGRQDAALEGFINEDGTWRAGNDPSEQAAAEDAARTWGVVEVGSGFAIPIVAGVGALVTGLLWLRESRAETSEPAISLQVGATRRGAQAGVQVRW